MDGNGQPLMSFGVMGGPMQAQGHMQMALRIMLHGQNPQAAIDAPRWRVVQGREVIVESTFDRNTIAALRERGSIRSWWKIRFRITTSVVRR